MKLAYQDIYELLVRPAVSIVNRVPCSTEFSSMHHGLAISSESVTGPGLTGCLYQPIRLAGGYIATAIASQTRKCRDVCPIYIRTRVYAPSFLMYYRIYQAH